MANSQLNEYVSIAVLSQILDTDGTNAVQILSSASGFQRIDAILLSNSDSISHVVTLRTGSGASAAALGSALCPARAGFDGNAMFALLAAAMPSGQVGLFLGGGIAVYAEVAVALTSGNQLSLLTQGGLVN